MAVQELTKRKHKVAIMNAVHDLPVLVARDKGFFKDEGLDIEFVTTPGMAQVTTSHTVKFDSVFDRPLDAAYNEGGIDQYRMCEWGIMKRAVEASSMAQRSQPCSGRRRARSTCWRRIRRHSFTTSSRRPAGCSSRRTSRRGGCFTRRRSPTRVSGLTMNTTGR